MSEVPGARTHAAPIEVPDDLPEDVAAALRAVLPVVTAAADRERFDPEVPAAFVRAGSCFVMTHSNWSQPISISSSTGRFC